MAKKKNFGDEFAKDLPDELKTLLLEAIKNYYAQQKKPTQLTGSAQELFKVLGGSCCWCNSWCCGNCNCGGSCCYADCNGCPCK